MKIILDTANKQQIEKYSSLLDGVTSNPFLLKDEELTPWSFLDMTKDWPFWRFVQINNFQQFEEIHKKFDSTKIVYKVTMNWPHGFNLAKKIRETGAYVASTTMYDIVQLNNAIELGLDWSMVYLAKNEDEHFLEEAVELKEKTNSNIKLVAASFRTKNDVKRAIKSGIEYATIPPHVLELALFNNQVDADYDKLTQ